LSPVATTGLIKAPSFGGRRGYASQQNGGFSALAAWEGGRRYFNKELMDDLGVHVLKPEVLVYAPGPDGQLEPRLGGLDRLAAVEKGD
jgi:hypothetical protein